MIACLCYFFFYLPTSSVVITGVKCRSMPFDTFPLLSCRPAQIVIPADAMDGTGEPSTEKYKTLGTFSDVVDRILSGGIDKRSAIISLGGGVVNNISGFIAASLYRGITLVHFSTTMMGQVCVCVIF